MHLLANQMLVHLQGGGAQTVFESLPTGPGYSRMIFILYVLHPYLTGALGEKNINMWKMQLHQTFQRRSSIRNRTQQKQPSTDIGMLQFGIPGPFAKTNLTCFIQCRTCCLLREGHEEHDSYAKCESRTLHKTVRTKSNIPIICVDHTHAHYESMMVKKQKKKRRGNPFCRRNLWSRS